MNPQRQSTRLSKANTDKISGTNESNFESSSTGCNTQPKRSNKRSTSDNLMKQNKKSRLGYAPEFTTPQEKTNKNSSSGCIFFGDNVPKDRANMAMEAAKGCDATLLLSSSVMSMSAIRLVRLGENLYHKLPRSETGRNSVFHLPHIRH